MVALTPSFFGEATNLSLLGQLTVVQAPGPRFHSSSMAPRCVVNTNVVPLASARRTTVMSWSGNVMPGLAVFTLGLLHFVILPRKMPE